MLSGIALLFIFLHQPPEHQASARVSGLRLSATNDVTVTTPGFVLIVLLVISLWLHCFGHIIDCIALIALIALTVLLVVLLIALLWLLWLLWPYRWSYRFDFRVWKCSLLLVSFSLSVPQTASGLRRNSPLWWITHLYLIIQQDPSAYIEPLNHLELRLDLFP